MSITNEKIRIVVVGTRGFPRVQGGVENHCENLYPRLVKLGCEVVVFTRKTYVDETIKEYKGVKLIALPIVRYKSFEAFLHTFIGVVSAIKYQPGILHIQAIGPALFTPLARILGMKVVVTSHGSNYKHLKWGRFAKTILRLGEFFGIRFANEVIAISRPIADEIKLKYGHDVNIIPNGVDIQPIINSIDVIQKYGLENRQYLLSVGRFVPEKGFHDLIVSFNAIKSKKWKLVIIGQADHEDACSMGIKKEAAANNNIILTGFLSGMALQELYSHAGLFILPSYYEGLPISLLEAMSYGLSCIASDIPANREVGLAAERYFKAGDAHEMEKKIIKFISKPLNETEKREQVAILEHRYNWDKIADKTFEVYKKALGKIR